MSEIQIKVGSITNAQRIKKLLKQNGIKASIQRSSNIKRGEGCGYSVTATGYTDEITELVKHSKIKYLKMIEI